MAARGWQFWIDRGGTFTDVIGRSPAGELLTRKLLSAQPGQDDDAAVAGIEAILSERDPQGRIDVIRMGTTVATNALLERRGEPTVLVITEGFGDALLIGYQDRPDLFALNIQRPAPLHGPVIEAAERVDTNGEVLTPLDTGRLGEALTRQRRAGYRSVAICLMHGFRFPAHELAAGALARELGFEQVSLSHETSPLIRLVSRGDTTVADAYLSPVLDRYVRAFRAQLKQRGRRPGRLLFMQSNGGLVVPDHFRGKDSVLSGPAGGVVGMVAACDGIGEERLIGFDMGGTSTDVSLYAGEFETVNDSVVGGVRLRVPMLRIHTIAAGGGSILKFADGRFQVGPESAGADPGPMSYRRGGPLTVTDANLALGRLRPEHFPRVFGAGENEPLDAAAVATAFADLARRVSDATGRQMGPAEVAAGFLRIAADNMANAIKTVSVQRGHDPAAFTLCCFGGAGGQHACQVADALGITRIVIHPLAGLLSAWGMGVAPLRTYRQASVELPLDDGAAPRIRALCRELGQHCADHLRDQGVEPDSVRVRTILNLRVPGADVTLPVIWRDDHERARADFAAEHRRRFGFTVGAEAVYVESLRVDATGETQTGIAAGEAAGNGGSGELQSGRLFCDGSWRDAPIRPRADLGPGSRVDGPALVVEPNATTVVEPGWSLEIDPSGRLLLARTTPQPERLKVGAAADPVLLELFNNHFVNAAEQMGAVLENTAHSVNIKERRDFSCAIFDAMGRLVANAPHIPVHLGSMGDSVQAILRARGASLRPGDVYMLNDPYAGGTHLPDVTVVTPVFDAAGTRPVFVVACRAHHADIGGCTPGSMPAFSTDIGEEGVRFQDFPLVAQGRFLEAELRELLASGPYPARNVGQNVADLRAQLAANERGVDLLREMVAHFGLDTVSAYMEHVQENAAGAVRRVIRSLAGGEFCCEMDGGEQIRVRVSVDSHAERACIDFSGTSPQSPGNLNAPPGVARAVVLYIFRCLVAGDIPLNAGCLLPLDIRLPRGSLLNPEPPAAVAGGNVETSQCIADALCGALGIAAASQGTMNNLSFGDARHQYYETICGGAGAGPDFDGASAVQTHMTNSRITDPEVLETRFPVLVRDFAIRRGSGGRGRRPGGDGAVRALEFCAAMDITLLTNRRRTQAFGLAGGDAGKAGQNLLVRASGEVEVLAGIASARVAPGDVVLIATPGGGGYGVIGEAEPTRP